MTTTPTNRPPIDAALAHKLANDPHRPQFHFLPPANWMNDPNGLIHWRGTFHMFYQHYPYEAVHRDMHWGHATSPDLVHWTHQPFALVPSPDGPDAGGVWSGCTVDDNGVPTFIYSGNPAVEEHHLQLPCLAFGDDELLTWQKYDGNPLNAMPPTDLDVLEFRDHSCWREGETWYMAIGAGIRDVGGAALLFRSPDLRVWEYVGPLATGDHTRTEPHWTGTVWECPDFFRLGDTHVLTVSVWANNAIHYVAYMTGTYADHQLTVEREGLVDLGDSFYAPQSFYDADGRRIMFGWLRETRTVAAHRAAGWAGVMSLPRVLGIDADGDLTQTPAPELKHLRGEHVTRGSFALAPDTANPLADVRGTQLEIIVRVERGDAERVGLKVLASPDGDEETVIVYDFAQGQLLIDRTRSSPNPETQRDVQGRPFALRDSEALTLHIFVDHSVIEVFANERACLTERVYPEDAHSDGVTLFAEGGTATIEQIDVWQINGIWNA